MNSIPKIVRPMQNKSIKQPLVSVIIPVYNGREYLVGCLETIKNQTYKNFEVIVVDDGSTDGTDWLFVQLIDPRIKVFHKKNGGVSSARNFGLDNCAGKYVTFVDIDDTLDSRYLEVAVSDAIRTDSDIVVCNSTWCDFTKTAIRKNRGNEFISFPADYTPNFWDIYFKPLMPIWSKLFKRSALKGLRFNEELNFWEDFLFVGCAFSLVNKVHFVDYVGYNHIYRPNSATERSTREEASAKKAEADLVVVQEELKRHLGSIDLRRI